MPRVFLSHNVRDYDLWKAGYDSDAPRLQSAGLMEVGHFHKDSDRNKFLIVWEVEGSVEQVKAMDDGMMSDSELAQLMEEAGVLEKPVAWVADET